MEEDEGGRERKRDENREILKKLLASRVDDSSPRFCRRIHPKSINAEALRHSSPLNPWRQRESETQIAVHSEFTVKEGRSLLQEERQPKFSVKSSQGSNSWNTEESCRKVNYSLFK